MFALDWWWEGEGARWNATWMMRMTTCRFQFIDKHVGEGWDLWGRDLSPHKSFVNNNLWGRWRGTEGNQIFNFFIVHRNGLSGPDLWLLEDETDIKSLDSSYRVHGPECPLAFVCAAECCAGWGMGRKKWITCFICIYIRYSPGDSWSRYESFQIIKSPFVIMDGDMFSQVRALVSRLGWWDAKRVVGLSKSDLWRLFRNR